MGIYMTSGLVINTHILEDIVIFDWVQIPAGHKKNEFIYEYRDHDGMSHYRRRVYVG